jgi:hypothetical protein
MRALLAVLAAAVLAGCATRGAVTSPSPGTGPQGARQGPTDYSGLILRPGDQVRVSGRVVAVPHGPVRLCAPVPVPAAADEDPDTCSIGIRADGIDLSRVQLRTVEQGTVSGYAAVRATYQGDRLRVTWQGRWHRPAEPPLLDRPPCPAPNGGWGTASVGGNLYFGPVSRYARTHPGAIVDMALMRPGKRQVIALVLTSGDPRPVTAALAQSYPRQLCVVRSRFTRAELRHALRVFDIPQWQATPAREWAVGESWTRRGQVYVDVDLLRVTPAVASAASGLRPGLLSLHPFLRPWRH